MVRHRRANLKNWSRLVNSGDSEDEFPPLPATSVVGVVSARPTDRNLPLEPIPVFCDNSRFKSGDSKSVSALKIGLLVRAHGRATLQAAQYAADQITQ